MKLNEIYKSDKTKISFEIFPPDSDENIQKLYEEIEILKNYKPEFISLTHSVTGKNKENSRIIFTSVKNRFNLNVMPHFTCICSSVKDINDNLDFFKSMGTENILALRGDIPDDKNLICKDFCYANELVKYLKEKNDFSIAVAGYPEGHIESHSIKDDIKNLKKKVDAGADIIITQMFFDNCKFFEYLNLIQNAGINIPVIAGIMPVFSKNQLDKMTKLAKITIPEKFKEKLERYIDDKDYIKKTGIEFATEQCRELIENNMKGLHFFTLNKAYSTSKILENIF